MQKGAEISPGTAFSSVAALSLAGWVGVGYGAVIFTRLIGVEIAHSLFAAGIGPRTLKRGGGGGRDSRGRRRRETRRNRLVGIHMNGLRVRGRSLEFFEFSHGRFPCVPDTF